MLAVPKVHILYKGRDQDEHLRLMGYKRLEQAGDAKTGNAGPQWEATDDYASRMQGFMMFYGALCQSEQPGNPVDLAHAWRFVARSAGLAHIACMQCYLSTMTPSAAMAKEMHWPGARLCDLQQGGLALLTIETPGQVSEHGVLSCACNNL